MSRINGGTPDKPKYSFAVIKHRNSLHEATTADGFRVRREETLFMSGFGRFVMCAAYDNHFVYLDPAFDDIVGRWFCGCTCGSFAVIAGANVYKKDASPSSGGTIPGELLVCYAHGSTGKHADGSS